MSNNKGKFGGIGFYLMLVVIVAAIYMLATSDSSGGDKYSYNDFITDVGNNRVEEVVIRQR